MDHTCEIFELKKRLRALERENEQLHARLLVLEKRHAKNDVAAELLLERARRELSGEG